MFRLEFQQHSYRHGWFFRWVGKAIKYFIFGLLSFGIVIVISISLGFSAIISIVGAMIPQVFKIMIFLLGLGAIATIIEGLR